MRGALRSVRLGCVVLMLGLAAGGSPLQAQQPRTRAAAAAGVLALAGGRVESGLGIVAQIGVQHRGHHVALRGQSAVDLAGFPDGGDDVVAELSALYGRVVARGWGHASASTGLSVVRFDSCPGESWQASACTTPGIPIVLEAVLSARVVGLGAQLFGTVTPRALVAGIAIGLYLGWLP